MIDPFLQQIKTELDELLAWWLSHMVDEQNGGFYGRIDGHGLLHPQADKAVILNTRILWTFAAAARFTQNKDYHTIADRAFSYICDHFIDEDSGGVFWMLDYAGEVVHPKKQIYAQAFAIYGLTEYYLLTKNEKALKTALDLFQLVEKYSKDDSAGGYFEAFTHNWQTLDDLRLSDKDANEAKTMNTHLHILEAYTNLYRAVQREDIRLALKGIIECFLERFIDPRTFHLHLFFDENWGLKSQQISFGHDIEFSWLVLEAAKVLGDQSLESRALYTSLNLAEPTLMDGLDQDGGLFYEQMGPRKYDREKHWWPQAEAVVGFWNAWEISGEIAFQIAAIQCWDFIRSKLKDPENGEWYWSIDKNGIPNKEDDKAGPWKAPYHNGRMCLEILKRNQ